MNVWEIGARDLFPPALFFALHRAATIDNPEMPDEMTEALKERVIPG